MFRSTLTGVMGLVLATTMAAAPVPGALVPREAIRLRGCYPTMTETRGGVKYIEYMTGTICRQSISVYIEDGEPFARYPVSYKGELIAVLTTDATGDCSCTLTGASELGRTPPLPMLRKGYLLEFGEETVCMF